MPTLDRQVILIALKTVSEALDRFVDACTDENGNPKAPVKGEIYRARSYLPPYCKNAFKK